jgi:hypothetical protein
MHQRYSQKRTKNRRWKRSGSERSSEAAMREFGSLLLFSYAGASRNMRCKLKVIVAHSVLQRTFGGGL